MPFSNGRTVRRFEEDGRNCAEFREDLPIAGAAALAGKYYTVTDERDGLTVRVSSYGLRNDKAAKRIARLVHGYVEFYEPLLGDYPFAEVDVLEINSLGLGQAPAGIIYITREAFNPMRDEASQAFSKGINARLAHEFAHAWWGHVSGLSELEDQWLSEAIAEYDSALAMANLKHKREFKKARNRWKGDAKEVAGDGSVDLANFSTRGSGRSSRSRLLYSKGALMLAALHQELGDEASSPS